LGPREVSKVHVHEEQFDGHQHPWCGRGDKAVSSDKFEGTAPSLRCRFCDREWFRLGQPDWHYRAALKRLHQHGTSAVATARR
jgi:hypothetical protein